VYEVGGEVVEAIGTTAVFCPADPKSSKDKFLLNLSATAAKQLSDAAPGATVVTADVCTISASVSSSSGKHSPLFHSYRRDGAKSGRNLTFVRV
jgi:copper oxidase (laccase) domain-containing protein